MVTGYEHDYYIEHKELVKATIIQAQALTVIARELKRLNDKLDKIYPTMDQVYPEPAKSSDSAGT